MGTGGSSLVEFSSAEGFILLSGRDMLSLLGAPSRAGVSLKAESLGIGERDRDRLVFDGFMIGESLGPGFPENTGEFESLEIEYSPDDFARSLSCSYNHCQS